MPFSTIERWHALGRQRGDLSSGSWSSSFAICAVLYAIVALLDHSWWRPAITMAAIAVVWNLERYFDRRYNVMARFRRRTK
jgi:hypothetical protein